MLKWLAVIVTVGYFLLSFPVRRFLLHEEKDERGQWILCQSYRYSFPWLIYGWAAIYVIDAFHELTYEQFQLFIAVLIVGTYLLQTICLLLLKRKY
ncbi:MAG: hypothetical protein IRY98_13155 [Alicyclobacillaceae bacterium]|nr:hypothetical protein [Alicyclobacillaceae bacterium]